jgi:hypothetical protein
VSTEQHKSGFLRDSRVYLSGPMDFVASRVDEKRTGWRVRVKAFLQSFGVTVFDPWETPAVRGLEEYGHEDVNTANAKERWTFEDSSQASKARTEIADRFWETMHIDLRMVDISDFVIAYCPTNIYSVGTPHEIIVARNEHKPVLFVSPPVDFPALDQLHEHLSDRDDAEGRRLLEELERQVPIKRNPRGIPSLWYLPLIGGDRFFDGFGFELYRNRFDWSHWPIDENEAERKLHRPLLPYIEKLNEQVPRRWNRHAEVFEQDDDWLLLNLEREAAESRRVTFKE